MQNLQKLLDPKLIAGAVVLALWLGLILAGQAATPAGAGFIDVLKEILYGLAGWHAVTNLQSSSGAQSAQFATLGSVAELAAPAVIGAVEGVSPAVGEVVSVVQKAAPVVEAVAEAVEAAPVTTEVPAQ